MATLLLAVELSDEECVLVNDNVGLELAVEESEEVGDTVAEEDADTEAEVDAEVLIVDVNDVLSQEWNSSRPYSSRAVFNTAVVRMHELSTMYAEDNACPALHCTSGCTYVYEAAATILLSSTANEGHSEKSATSIAYEFVPETDWH